MAESYRHGGGGGGAYGFLGIPTGLNRIKTRPDDSDPTSSRRSTKPSSNTGHVKFFRSKQGLRKEKKISRWLNSTLFKHSDRPKGDSPPAEPSAVEFNKADKEDPRKKIRKMREIISGDSPSITSTDKASKCLKSFSQELGPKGGIQSIHPKAHSCNNFKDLLRSLRSRFDAAKEDVNRELDCFSQELLENLRKPGSLDPDEHKIAEELYVLAQECMHMTSLDFRGKCETIVQDLTVKRQICQAGVLKLLFTRVLFILTRCTRLLHFEKDSGPVNEQSLDKFRECLQSIPSVDTNWVVNNGFADSDSVNFLKPKSDAKPKIQGIDLRDWAIENRSKGLSRENDIELKTNDNSIKETTQVVLPDPLLGGGQFHKVDGNFHVESINRDKEKSSDDSDFVICRICEESVPAIHLETHSYICAYAENCVSRHSDVDERLLKLAELLEHLLEVCDSSSHEPPANPEALKMRNTNSTLASEISSPTCSELRSKGMDGILEDLHEMDTACIDDSNVANLMNLKNHLLTKVYQCGPPSSNGSMGSSSSANSPRSGNFDFFWLDQNNLSEQEDMQQIINLADIARCVAGACLSEEGSHEFLLACLEDLQEIFQHSKQKALIVDTFGSRIESLLREKYVLACSLVDRTADIKYPESARSLLDITSQSSSTSTPSHPVHKESTCIDDFDIIKPISRGAFGKVFLARKRTTGDLFAIKVLKKLDMLRKNDIDRILAERNILIAARNPFVVRFFYSFTSVDKLYLVMEYLNGGDLYSLLIKVGCLEEAVARTYIAELVLALEYLHSLGIVHRDLKPDNILIAHDGHIKLTDFGLSKIGLMNSTTELSAPETAQLDISDVNSKFNADMENSHKSAVGTPDYLAPEILLGREHGFAADWWSVGIILFELLTGIPPFTADHPELIFDNILNRKVPWPSVPTDMSYEAQDLIDRLLVHDPSLRLGSKGASEVKAHSFFLGVDWDNLTFQNAAFVPQPDSIDDTSYFVSRYNSNGIELDNVSMDSATDSSELHPNSGIEMDECGDLSEVDSSPLHLSLMNFSFKNLSQLASINHDVLLQSGKSSKGSSPSKASKSVGS